jgi:hypothetical protein
MNKIIVMKILKKILMYLGTITLMIFHGFIIIKDGGFSFPVAAGFVVLHFIWFDVLESWIKNKLPIFNCFF